MADQNSILDKIIQSKQIQEATQFNPTEVIANILKNLSNKERDILSKRFGLFGKPKETLEEIGKAYQITRERIRQIEVGTVKKIKDIPGFQNHLEPAEHNVMHLLENYGGIMEENHLIDELLTYSEANPANRQASLFIISNLLNDKLEKVKPDNEILVGWKLPAVTLDVVKRALSELAQIIEQENKLVPIEKLVREFKNKDFFQKSWEQITAVKMGSSQIEQASDEIDKIIFSFLKISRQIDQNILGEWGLAHWQTVAPKRMSDKAYLVLRKTNKPMHFVEITDLINQTQFDKKTAYPATIHNELILDDRYVLVGRGIYGLKEWGYKSGTVIDVIIDILKNAGEPLTKEEIVRRVLEQRIVRKSTIYLALTNKEKIKKLPDGKYALV